jgi:hypothetical protein
VFFHANLQCKNKTLAYYRTLNGQCHEIFDPRFFRQSITLRPLINTLKYFRFMFQIRQAITEYVFVQRYAT